LTIPGNPRINDDAVDAVDAVAASIREFGFRQPIVVDAEGVIICFPSGRPHLAARGTLAAG